MRRLNALWETVVKGLGIFRIKSKFPEIKLTEKFIKNS